MMERVELYCLQYLEGISPPSPSIFKCLAARLSGCVKWVESTKFFVKSIWGIREPWIWGGKRPLVVVMNRAIRCNVLVKLAWGNYRVRCREWQTALLAVAGSLIRRKDSVCRGAGESLFFFSFFLYFLPSFFFSFFLFNFILFFKWVIFYSTFLSYFYFIL